MAIARQINVHTTVGKAHLAIACEAVGNDRQTLVAFDVTWSLEELIKDRDDDGFRCGNGASDRDFVRKLASNDSFIIREVNSDLYIQRRASR